MPGPGHSDNRSGADSDGAHVDVVDVLANALSLKHDTIKNYLADQFSKYRFLYNIFYYFGMTIISFVLSVWSLVGGDVNLIIFFMIFGFGLDLFNFIFISLDINKFDFVVSDKHDVFRFRYLRQTNIIFMILSFLFIYVVRFYFVLFDALRNIFPSFPSLCQSFFSHFGVFAQIDTIIQNTYHHNGTSQSFNFLMLSFTIMAFTELYLFYTFRKYSFWTIVANKKYNVLDTSPFWSVGFMALGILLSSFFISLFFFAEPYWLILNKHGIANDYYLDPTGAIGYLFVSAAFATIPFYMQFLFARVSIIKAANP